MIRVADYVMKRIAEEGVDRLFYVAGGQCVYLCDALRRSEGITPVAMHHEQACAMAALAYSEYTNNFGACLVTTGCAGTNTLTGVLHAWQDSIPMVVISGQQNYESTIKASGLPLRQVGIQEADTERIVSPITKYAVTIPDAAEIAYHIDKAFYLAKEGRKGPVWLDIPLNVQNAMVDEEKLERFVAGDSIDKKNVSIDKSEKDTVEESASEINKSDVDEAYKDDIDYVLEALKNAKRPILHIGYGVRSADAIQEMKRFVELTHVPVTFSRRTYDMMPSDAPYNMGVLNGAAGGHRYANFAVQNSDLLISIGSRLCRDTIGSNTDTFAREAKVIVIDIDEVEHKKNGVSIDKLIVSDAKKFLNDMLSAVGDMSLEYSEWIDKCNHWKEIFNDYKNPYTANNLLDAKHAMRRVTEKMPVGSVVVSDAGFTGAAATACTVFKEGDGLVHSFAQGEMGFSVPGACGVATATNAPVIAFEGDGSLMMNLQELQTIVRNQFNIKIVIINNNGYSGVRHGQKAHFRGKSIGTDSGNGLDFPDFGKIAAAFGIAYSKADSIEALDEAIQEMYREDAPFILEIMTDPDQFDLHNALVMYGKRKVGFRPIEDQSPFIDRDTFFEEMIIEPLETSSGKPI